MLRRPNRRRAGRRRSNPSRRARRPSARLGLFSGEAGVTQDSLEVSSGGDFTSVTRARLIPGMSTMEISPSSTSRMSRIFFSWSSGLLRGPEADRQAVERADLHQLRRCLAGRGSARSATCALHLQAAAASAQHCSCHADHVPALVHVEHRGHGSGLRVLRERLGERAREDPVLPLRATAPRARRVQVVEDRAVALERALVVGGLHRERLRELFLEHEKKCRAGRGQVVYGAESPGLRWPARACPGAHVQRLEHLVEPR
jgi:hypothetical protein